MISHWAEEASDDYLYWQRNDGKTFKRIQELLADVKCEPYDGVGKPEPLKHNWSGYWSRRITGEHRLVYKVENDQVLIAQCRFHY